MNERRKTLIAIGIVVVCLFVVICLISSFISGRRIVSPVPEEQGIKIIFLTPTPTVSSSTHPTTGMPKKSS